LEAIPILATHLATNSPSCIRYLKARYSHIFIDEYQDAGHAQHELFLAVRSHGLIAVAVGDLNQSIFKFAKRDPKFLVSLCETASGFCHISLTINHRSHLSIVNYAGRLLDQNFPLQQVKESMVFRRTLSDTPGAVCAWIDKNLDAFKNRFLIKDNSEIGILCLTGKSGRAVAASLATPSRFVAERKLPENDYHANAILFDLLKFRFDHSLTIQEILDSYSVETKNTFFQKQCRASILKCRTCSPADLLAVTVAAAEMVLRELVPLACQADFALVLLDQQQLNALMPKKPQELQIMTLHASKGLEFEMVIHLDLTDWVFPKKRVDSVTRKPYHEDYEQCLNLHYVGVTRAKKACILISTSERVNSSGKVMASPPSEFWNLPGLVGLHR
jgi:DNA helicase-2/ATP-dependent DNA helicase PcrA